MRQKLIKQRSGVTTQTTSHDRISGCVSLGAHITVLPWKLSASRCTVFGSTGLVSIEHELQRIKVQSLISCEMRVCILRIFILIYRGENESELSEYELKVSLSTFGTVLTSLADVHF